MELIVKVPTMLKTSVRDSSDLSTAEKASLKIGRYPILAYADSVAGHLKVTLDPARIDLKALHPSGINTWFVYGHHCELLGTEKFNQPRDTQRKNAGGQVEILGLGPRFLGHPIDGCKHFTWSEATHGGTRLPEGMEVVQGIIRAAKAMDGVRAFLGNESITINSWYRPRAINSRVGGASQSRHLIGDAVDFNHAVLNPGQVYTRLDYWWGTKGGLASSSVFTHIDVRGYKARWTYGF